MLTVKQIQDVGEAVAKYKPLRPEFHKSQKDFRWIFGGNQAGKSYTSMMDLAMLAMDIHPYRSAPNGIHWAAIESWEQVRDILWEQYLQKFIPPNQRGPISWGQNKIPKRIYLRNGHRIEFKAFNQGRELFQGRAIDSCHCDEQCHHDFMGIFNEIQARLMKRDGYLAWSMTPIIPQSELEERMGDLPDTDATFFVNLNDNRISRGGYVSDERIDALIADWPEEVQTTRIGGKFASYYGAVYKTFNRNTHVIKPFDIPKEWPKYRGFDFGFTNPFVCLWLAKDGDDNWYVYREYYKKQTSVGDHIKVVKWFSRKEQYVDDYADPEDARAREEMRVAGIPTLLARKNIFSGIETVQKKLKVKGNGKPSLFIFDNCKNTIREMAIYHHPEQKLRGANVRDGPVKKDDHTCDTLRYVLESVEHTVKGSVYVA